MRQTLANQEGIPLPVFSMEAWALPALLLLHLSLASAQKKKKKKKDPIIRLVDT